MNINKNQLHEFYEELDDLDRESVRSPRNRADRKRESRKQETDVNLFIRAQEHGREFKFTYKAARFEEAWLLDSLIEIAEHQWISDVIRKVKVGKEASVYMCRGGSSIQAPLVAAKIYRPRSLRNLKNDSMYRTGRTDLGEDGNALFREADVNAIIKRTKYGEELRHTSWIAYEFKTLEMLYSAGADVPQPIAMQKNAILMEYIGDAGSVAPLLNSIKLARNEAREVFDRIIRNLNLLLDLNLIHGDLSAYNILYWNGEIKLIDFPQVVSPEKNPSAWTIFLRDVQRVCQYIAEQGIKSNPRELAAELWTAHGHKITQDVDPSHLDAEDPNDRKLWEKQRQSSM